MLPRALPLLVFVTVATAAPVPKPKVVPISVANADKLQPVHEVKTNVSKILPGPKPGELTFVYWEKPVEAVDADTLKPVRTLVEGKPIDFAASPDGTRFAWCENDKTVRTRPADGNEVTATDVGNSQPGSAFSPNGKLLATGGYGTDAKVWDADGKLVRTLDCGGKGGLTPVFSPDGKVLAVGNRNDSTRLFDATTGKLLHLLPEKMTQQIAFSPDGKTLAAGYVRGQVMLWDVGTGEKKLSAKSGGDEVYSVAWSPAGDVLATSGLRGKVVVWDAATLKPLKELDAGQWVISVRFSDDGSRLYTAGGTVFDNTDRKVVVWGLQK